MLRYGWVRLLLKNAHLLQTVSWLVRHNVKDAYVKLQICATNATVSATSIQKMILICCLTKPKCVCVRACVNDRNNGSQVLHPRTCQYYWAIIPYQKLTHLSINIKRNMQTLKLFTGLMPATASALAFVKTSLKFDALTLLSGKEI